MRGPGSFAGALALVVAVFAFGLTLLAPCDVRAQDATNEEWALLVLVNEVRSDPSAFGYDRPVVSPLRWSDELARAARAHSADMAKNGCYQHDSCNGQTWWKRIQSFYSGWTMLAENVIAVGDTPQQLHDGWMASSTHRANILSGALVDFGAGMAVGEGHFGPISFATQDFGTRALPSLRSLPAIPAAAVLPRADGSGPRELVANFYDYDGPPRSVHALVGGSCVPLALRTGKPAHGTYAATRSFTGTGCVPVVFEAVQGDGTWRRFPASGAILIAVGGASCAPRSSETASQSCSADAAPQPTPTPPANPQPEDESALRDMRVMLAPGKANASKGQVTLVATLPTLGDFDPTVTPIRLAVRFPSGDWTRTLPVTCGEKPCFKSAARGKVFNAKLDQRSRASLRRDQRGLWTLRYSSRGESLGRVTPGSVTFTVDLGERRFTASGRGELTQNKLIAK